MTYYDCIRDIDRIEPNAYEAEDKIRWIREIEGRVWTELFLMQPIGFSVDNMMDLFQQELSIPAPYNKVYRHYLRAMIHYGNAEPDRYNMDIGLFNQDWHELCVWFGQDYDSSDWHRNRLVQCEVPLYTEIVELEENA